MLNQIIQLPKGTKFKGTFKDRTESFEFVTTESYQILADSIDLTFENVQLVQGTYSSFEVQIDNYNQNQIVELPSADIDTRFLEVYVQEGSDNTTFEKYENANGILTVADDPVYWLEEGPNGRFQIHFGDGVIGKSVGHGKVVKMIFVRTRGEIANNLSEFTYSASNNQFSNFLSSTFSSISVTTLSRSQGGSARESIDDIKFRAQRYKGSGANALRTQDYEERILTDFPEIRSVRVWDATYLDDPSGKIGKIFISAVPRNGTYFTNSRKNAILNDIQSEIAGTNKCFEFVDPEFIYPKLRIEVNLLSKGAKQSEEFIKSQIEDSIILYNDETLERFASNIELSDLTSIIVNSNRSIDNVITDIDLEVRITPCLDEQIGYTRTLNNILFSGTLSSDIFEIDNVRGYIKDDSNGKVDFYDENTNELVFSNIGSINYAKGTIELFPIRVTKGSDSFSDIRIRARAKNRNIKGDQQNILRIERDCIFATINTSIQNEKIKYS